jgi:hypothetical protein
MAIEPAGECIDPQWRYDAGVYVLGAMTSADRHRFEQHLHACRYCRDELVWLVGIRALLKGHGESGD